MSGPPGNPLARLAARIGAFLRGERLVELVVALTLLGGALMVIADFLTLFEIEIRGTVIDQPTGGEQHSYALAVMGVVVVVAALAARAAAAPPPAAAAAVLAVAALAIALIGDLPDATRSDLVRGGRIGEASPAGGFWLEVAGASIALTAAVALAMLLRRRAGARV